MNKSTNSYRNKVTKENVSNNKHHNKNEVNDEENSKNFLKTNFGYMKRRNAKQTPQKVPYSELVQRYKKYEDRVRNALKQQKVFKILSAYDVPTIRQELYRRGWVETVLHPWQNEYQKMTDTLLLEKAQPGNEFEHVLLSRITGEKTPSYVWLTANQLYNVHKHTPLLSKINIQNHNFGAKDGLCRYVELLKQDKQKKIKYRINHPRVYNATEENGLERFWQDFHTTAAFSIILFLDEQENIYDLFSNGTGTIDMKILDFTFQAVLKRIAELGGCVYSEKNSNEREIEEKQWNVLLDTHKAIIMNKETFLMPDNADWCTMKTLVNDYICQITVLAEEIRRLWKINRHDGIRNIWLLKPTNSSQGQGIVLSNEKEVIKKHLTGKTKFVLQKYIEKPLLVYNTKFDIRQYFMILIDQTHVRCFCHPVCSVKLASAEFSLDILNESIHITNAYVQQKYRFKSNPNLPPHHMWTLGTLILYLEQTSGAGHMWNEKVYPAMKRTIQSLFWMSVENIELKPGRFELFGCDWIITDDFKPYLLEVQRPPGMGIYSPVSKIVCPAVLSDVVKVSVDYFIDKTASCGEFECIAEIPICEVEEMKKSKDNKK